MHNSHNVNTFTRDDICEIGGVYMPVTYCVYCVWTRYSRRYSHVIDLDLLDHSCDIKYNWTTNIEDHIRRVSTADLRYPIFAIKSGNRYNIIDGCHRVIRARKEKRGTIRAIILTARDLANCITK